MTIRSIANEILRTVENLSALLCVLAVLGPALLLARTSEASAERARADVETVFHIQKSENRNQVHYGIRLNASCVPIGATPVYGYWRDLEDGPNARSELLSREEPAYGIGAQHVRLTESGATVRVRMRAFASRVITIDVSRDASGCTARAVTTIAGQRAQLDHIWAQIGFYSIDHIVLHGRRVSDHGRVTERIEQ